VKEEEGYETSGEEWSDTAYHVAAELVKAMVADPAFVKDEAYQKVWHAHLWNAVMFDSEPYEGKEKWWEELMPVGIGLLINNVHYRRDQKRPAEVKAIAERWPYTAMYLELAPYISL